MSQKKYKSVISTSQPNRFILLGVFDDLQILTIDGKGVGRISDPVVEDHRNTCDGDNGGNDDRSAASKATEQAQASDQLQTAIGGKLAGSLNIRGLAAAKGLGQDVPEVATTPVDVQAAVKAEVSRLRTLDADLVRVQKGLDAAWASPDDEIIFIDGKRFTRRDMIEFLAVEISALKGQK